MYILLTMRDLICDQGKAHVDNKCGDDHKHHVYLSNEGGNDYNFSIQTFFYDNKGKIINKNISPKEHGGYRGPMYNFRVYSDGFHKNCSCSATPSKIEPEKMTKISGTCAKTYNKKEVDAHTGSWITKEAPCPTPLSKDWEIVYEGVGGGGGVWGAPNLKIDNSYGGEYVLNTKPGPANSIFPENATNNPYNILCKASDADKGVCPNFK